MTRVLFWVSGISEPKGSTRSFYVPKMHRVVTTSANRNLKGWEQRIATEAQKVIPKDFYTDDRKQSYFLAFRFIFPRPQSLPKRVQVHTKKPDIDKLIRACGDALTGIAYNDDSQVDCIFASKHYVGDVDMEPGVRIEIEKKDDKNTTIMSEDLKYMECAAMNASVDRMVKKDVEKYKETLCPTLLG